MSSVSGWRAHKCLPVVFCLDVSGSMGPQYYGQPVEKTGIALLNHVVKQYLVSAMEHITLGSKIEVAFVLFADEIVLDTSFIHVNKIDQTLFQQALRRSSYSEIDLEPVTVELETGMGDQELTRSAQIPHFHACKKTNGTRLAAAVMYCIDKLERRIEDCCNAPYHTPHLVIVSNGGSGNLFYTERAHSRAIARIEEHCRGGRCGEDLIIPFVVSVGDAVNDKVLQRYAACYPTAYFRIHDASAVGNMKQVITALLSAEDQLKCNELGDQRIEEIFVI